MAESFSLQNLFKSGLTREQFLARYAEMKQFAEQNSSSIFNENMENSVAQIFDILNTSGETLDDSEIANLINMSEEDGEGVLSEADLKVLYQKIASNISSQNPIQSPEEMYNNAMRGVDSVYSSTYVQDLSSQIGILHQLKALRQMNSSALVANYKSQIDDCILKSNNLSNDFKTQYKNKSDEVSKLQKDLDKNNAELERLAQEKHELEQERQQITQELESFDPAEEEDKIALRKNELSSIDKRLAGVNDSISVLTSTQQKNKVKIVKSKSELNALTEEAERKDSALSAEIKNYKSRIRDEEDSLKNDLDDYEAKIDALTKAQAYAVEKIKEQEQYDADDSDFHKNDNLMSFDELSKNGLKYSGAKGEKLARAVRSHIKGFTGFCSRHVSNALAESGLGNERAASAHMMDSLLSKNSNFKEITISSAEDLKKLPAGCILVYEAGAARYSAQHGHIEVTLGDGTAGSDGVTRNIRYTQNMHVFVPVENA